MGYLLFMGYLWGDYGIIMEQLWDNVDNCGIIVG
jgi:hypothetical protein